MFLVNVMLPTGSSKVSFLMCVSANTVFKELDYIRTPILLPILYSIAAFFKKQNMIEKGAFKKQIPSRQHSVKASQKSSEAKSGLYGHRSHISPLETKIQL